MKTCEKPCQKELTGNFEASGESVLDKWELVMIFHLGEKNASYL